VKTGGDPLLAYATATAPESVNIATAITNFRTSLNQDWQLSYSGCLTPLAPDTGTYKLPPPGLRLQYAFSPNGPWYALNAGHTLGRACGANAFSFSGTTNAPSNYAYYRMYYPGSPGIATPAQPRFLASRSGASLSWKYLDRITAFSVSPHVVSNGGKLTVKGQLQYYYRTWHDYAKQLIYIILRQKGSSTWYWIVKVKTNSTGRFSATFNDDAGSATWAALFEGNSTHLSAGTPGVYVRVK
jgi:hypothetical protein